jgi:hypothetical protein
MYSYIYKKELIMNLLVWNYSIIIEVKCDVIATYIAASLRRE